MNNIVQKGTIKISIIHECTAVRNGDIKVYAQKNTTMYNKVYNWAFMYIAIHWRI